MKILNKLVKSGRLDLPWWLWLAQGSLVLIVGTLFAIESLLKVDVYILSTVEFSWLPICAMIILVLGFFDLIDAIFAKEVCDFMQRMNAGVLDVVFGVLLLFGVSDTPDRLSLMIALYLLVRSILRAVFAVTLRIPHLSLTLAGCVISLILGLMIWLEWPTHESWFFAFSLSTEIAFRGFLMICFAYFIKKRMTGID